MKNIWNFESGKNSLVINVEKLSGLDIYEGDLIMVVIHCFGFELGKGEDKVTDMGTSIKDLNKTTSNYHSTKKHKSF